jgi:hypothetical protein
MIRLVPAFFLVSCIGPPDADTGAVFWRTDGPDLVCPGDPGCETAAGALSAGAAALAITPTCFEQWLDCGEDGICPHDEDWVAEDGGEGDAEYDLQTEFFLDCGCDQLCPGDEGYAAADEGEADGVFQAMWLAGFQNGRPANSVHDDLWARAVVVDQGDLRVGIVTLDVVGFFYNDVQAIRELVTQAGADVDHVIVSSTHNHEAPDTLGQWGLQIGRRGVDVPWHDEVKRIAADAVVAAVDALQPAELLVVDADVSEDMPEKGTRNQISDHRDPKIVDENMGIAWLRSSADGSTIATLLNFGNHPETLADENTAITSDFPHYVRDGMENGVDWASGPVDGLGGVSLYLQASVGGMMTPLGVTVTDRDGAEFSQSTFDKAQAIGHLMASQALESLQDATPSVGPSLALRVSQIYMPIDNVAFQAMYLMGVFKRPAFNYDPDENLTDDNIPELQTEMNVFDLGPIRMLTIPGELLPELAVGGFDGSHTNIGASDEPLVNLEVENAADLSKAPEGPFLKDRMAGEYNWILGLGNDELGYIIPEYNFVLDELVPYLNEAEGDHYEETNSLGPRTAGLIELRAAEILGWTPPD